MSNLGRPVHGSFLGVKSFVFYAAWSIFVYVEVIGFDQFHSEILNYHDLVINIYM